MFCPTCRCEFREGFTRCENCNVALVADPSAAPGAPKLAPEEPTLALPMAEYCGFFSLDEARQARDQLREERIRSEILIRDIPGSTGAQVEEEFWLRVEVAGFKRAAAILGFDAHDESKGEAFECGHCGHTVQEHEDVCPGCGAGFLDDD